MVHPARAKATIRGVLRSAAAALCALALLAPARPVAAQVAPAPAALSPSDGAELSREVTDLAAWVAKKGGRASLMVWDAESGRTVAAHDADRPLNPASNMKLLTAATALSVLGPAHRFTTGLYGRVENGTARHLVLRGDGDPDLRVEHLERMVRTLTGLGLTQVGEVLVDQSRFDDRYVPPAFEQQPDEWAAFRAPVSAVALEENTLTVLVEPASDGEGAARVLVEPAGFAKVVARVQTRAPGSGQSVSVSVKPDGERVTVEVRGHIARGLPRATFVRRVDDPRLFAGFVLRELLSRAGVTVTGGVAAGGTDERASLTQHSSEPMARLIHALGKQSDNFAAEMLLKALGARDGVPATSAAGAAVVARWLADTGTVSPGTVITNGSGLFDANRVAAADLNRALVLAWDDPRVGPEFVAQLAIGGVDGTLRSRFRAQRETRAVRAKTGTLARVVALSGYVLAPRGRRPVVFALLVNDAKAPHAEIRARMDRVVSRAARALWSVAPAAE